VSDAGQCVHVSMLDSVYMCLMLDRLYMINTGQHVHVLDGKQHVAQQQIDSRHSVQFNLLSCKALDIRRELLS